MTGPVYISAPQCEVPGNTTEATHELESTGDDGEGLLDKLKRYIAGIVGYSEPPQKSRWQSRTEKSIENWQNVRPLLFEATLKAAAVVDSKCQLCSGNDPDVAKIR